GADRRTARRPHRSPLPPDAPLWTRPGDLPRRSRPGRRLGAARRMSQPLPVASEDMAKPWHLSEELFRRFLDHEVSLPERRAVVRHLVSQCPECLGLVGRIVAEGGYWFGKEVAEGLAEHDRVLASFEAAEEFTDR